MSYTPDVQGEEILLLWRRADSEGVPFRFGNGGNLDKDPITRGKVEVVGTLDDEVGDLCN